MAKNLPANAGYIRDTGSIPGSGRSGHGGPLQYSCLENPMDRGAWRGRVHRASKSQTQMKQLGMPLNSPIEHWVFILAIIFFSSKISIWFYFMLHFLVRLTIFSFVTSVLIITCWSIFMMATLKYFSDNCNVCVILVLASVDRLYLLKLRFFWLLVRWMIFDCVWTFLVLCEEALHFI